MKKKNKCRFFSRRRHRARLTRRTLTRVLAALCGFVLLFAVYLLAFSGVSRTRAYIYIRSGEPVDSLYARLDTIRGARTGAVRFWMNVLRLRGSEARQGRYEVGPDFGALRLARNVVGGRQAPVQLQIRHTWATPEKMAAQLASQLSPRREEWEQALRDTALLAQYGVDRYTWPTLFIPDTYEVYWDTTPAKFLARMQRESARFWTKERLQKAQQLDLTAREVLTLASIVAQETSTREEYPLVAGLYLNRLRIQMPLQADPTVKFGVGDLSLRRITGVHLAVESPYNTYKHRGLPPGPIAFPPIATIDAVLSPARHNFLYMCGKEDFTDRHNFAVTYAEHQQNARRYIEALNQRGIH